MNTAINVNPVSGVAAGAKVAHVFRAHSLKPKRNSSEDERTNHAIIIRDFVRTPSTAKGVRELSAKLATYRKRAEEATKPKTKERNLANCRELEKEMATRGKKRKGREAELVEASWAITKFPPLEALAHDPKIYLRIAKIAEKMVTKYFGIPPEKVGIAAHLDQASMHVHTLFSVPEGTTFTELLKGAKYAEIQREFNTLIREEFKDLEIQKITGFKKYETLGDYKKSSVAKLEQELAKAKSSVETYKKLYESTDKLADTYKKRYEAEKAKAPVVTEKEKVVEKIVTVENTTKIEELQEALKTTNDTLSSVQSAFSAQNANMTTLALAIESSTEYKRDIYKEQHFDFIKRVVSSLVEKVQSLSRQISLLLSVTEKESTEEEPKKEHVAEKETTANFQNAFKELQDSLSSTDLKI